MIVGVIKTKDLIKNPREVYMIHGFKGCLRLIIRALSRKKYQFVDFLEVTTRGIVGKK